MRHLSIKVISEMLYSNMGTLMSLLWILFLMNLSTCQNFVSHWDSIPRDNIVYLVATNNEEHIKINENFLNSIGPNMIRVQTLELPSLELEELLLAQITHKYLIHLYVSDFYKYNYNDDKIKEFVYMGDIGERVQTKVYYTDIKMTVDADPHKTTIIKDIDEKIKVKMVTRSLIDKCDDNRCTRMMNINFKAINEMITDYTGSVMNAKFTGNKIVICNSSNVAVFYDRPFDIIPIADCQRAFEYNPMAILASKPFETPDVIDIPTIFYDQDHLLPETVDLFTNSLALVRSGEPMKYAILEYMKLNLWNRVAVVSDDSPYSQQFEAKLTELFDSKNVVYVAKQCIGSSCNFTQALKTLHEANSKIIIANVEEKYADMLYKQAQRYELRLSNNVVWIARSWSQKTSIKAAKFIDQVLSISLEPSYYNIVKDENVVENIEKNRIDAALYSIQCAVSESNSDNAKSIKNCLYKQLFALITRTTSNGTVELPMYCAIHNEDRVNCHQRLPLQGYHDQESACTLKTMNYYKPCNDYDLIYILAATVVFAMTLLGIVYFFDNSAKTYSRMLP